MIKVVLADLDDFIIKETEERVHGPAWDHMLRPYGYYFYLNGNEKLRPVPEDKRPGLGMRPPDVTRHFVNELNLSGQGIDWRTLEQQRRGFVYQRIKDPSVRIELNDGGMNFLQGMRESGLVFGIVTSGTFDYAGAALKRLGILQEVAVLVNGGSTVRGKPHEDPWEFAVYQLEKRRPDLKYVSRDQIVGMGDSGRDIAGIKKAGMFAIGLENPHTSREKHFALGADLVVARLDEIDPRPGGTFYQEPFISLSSPEQKTGFLPGEQSSSIFHGKEG